MPRPRAAIDVFQAIADPTRRRLLQRLARGEQPVGNLARAQPVTLSAVSQHLRVLLDAGLVRERRVGRERRYRLRAAPLRRVEAFLRQYRRS